MIKPNIFVLMLKQTAQQIESKIEEMSKSGWKLTGVQFSVAVVFEKPGEKPKRFENAVSESEE